MCEMGYHISAVDNKRANFIVRLMMVAHHLNNFRGELPAGEDHACDLCMINSKLPAFFLTVQSRSDKEIYHYCFSYIMEQACKKEAVRIFAAIPGKLFRKHSHLIGMRPESCSCGFI